MANMMRYKVAYVNWTGEWTSLPDVFKTRTAAEKVCKRIARTKALNGRATVYIV